MEILYSGSSNRWYIVSREKSFGVMHYISPHAFTPPTRTTTITPNSQPRSYGSPVLTGDLLRSIASWFIHFSFSSHAHSTISSASIFFLPKALYLLLPCYQTLPHPPPLFFFTKKKKNGIKTLVPSSIRIYVCVCVCVYIPNTLHFVWVFSRRTG